MAVTKSAVKTASRATAHAGVAAKKAVSTPAKAVLKTTGKASVPPKPSLVTKPSMEAQRATSVITKSSHETSVKILTEAQLVKMPAKDYMNADQLAFFRALLQGQATQLRDNAGETSEHLRETPSVPDPADRATIEEEHALELRTRDRERKLLKKIGQAISRIDQGEYGFCDETGDPIGIPRLLARPTATLSIEAQQRRELRQKLYGD
jgi:DnaK suppressor protein